MTRPPLLNIRCCAWFLFCATLVCFANAAELSAKSLKHANDLFELARKDVPIALAKKIKGTMFRSGQSVVNFSGPLVVHLSGSQNNFLCVEIGSQDGFYIARRSFVISEVVAGENEIRMQLKQLKFLTRYAPSELAVRATVTKVLKPSTEDCSEYGESRLIPVNWSNQVIDANYVTIFAQAKGAQLYFRLSGEDQDVKCEQTASESVTSYDTVCQIPIGPGPTIQTVEFSEYEFNVERDYYSMEFAVK